MPSAGVPPLPHLDPLHVYWRPIFNLLEEQFTVILANAAHVKAVPGRRTDVRDSEWLLELLQHGLIRVSFIPPAPSRELRELMSYRTSLIEERTREVNRVQKVLEDANIRLAAVATDTLGQAGLGLFFGSGQQKVAWCCLAPSEILS